MGTNSFVWAAVLIMATLDALKDVNGATVNRKFRAQQLIDSIPAEERGHFITMQLAKAAKLIDHNVTIYTGTDSGNARDLFVYSLEEEDKYKDLDVPEDFCISLLKWVENNMVHFQHRSNRHQSDEAGGVCDSRGCVDPSDIGGLCCPF